MGRKSFSAIILVSSLSFILIASSGWAYCTCVCINGENQPICSNDALDIEPICPPKLCPTTTPDIELQGDPPDEPECHIVKVYDEYSERFVWQEVCD